MTSEPVAQINLVDYPIMLSDYAGKKSTKATMAVNTTPSSNIYRDGCYVSLTDYYYIVGNFTYTTTDNYPTNNPTVKTNIMALRYNGFDMFQVIGAFASTAVNDAIYGIRYCPETDDLLVFGNFSTPEPMMLKIHKTTGAKKTWVGPGALVGGDELTYDYSDTINSIYIYPNGDILVAGNFYKDSSDPTLPRYMMKMDKDGVPYGSGDFLYYRTINGVSSVNVMHVIQYGVNIDKILVSEYNSIDGFYLSMINSDGSLDATFDRPVFDFNRQVYSILSLKDGNILIGGDFTTVNGVARNGLALLDPTGTLL